MVNDIYYPTAPQIGITQSGQYSPRLEILQTELKSGLFGNQDSVAAVKREIDRVFTGKTGDMNASVATPGFNPSSSNKLLGGWENWKESFANQWGNLWKSGTTGATDTPGATQEIEGDGSFFGLAKHAGRVGLFLVGALLLVGAFLVYRK